MNNNVPYCFIVFIVCMHLVMVEYRYYPPIKCIIFLNQGVFDLEIF